MARIKSCCGTAPQEERFCTRSVVCWQQVKKPGVGQRKEAFLHQEEEDAALASMQPNPQRLVIWETALL